MTITRDSLLTLEAYARIRKSSKPEVIAHRIALERPIVRVELPPTP